MFGIKIGSWETLVSEFAQELDSSNMEAWPYVDLTDQCVGTHINSDYADPTCEEDMNGHELVEIEPKSSHEGFEFMERFAETRPEAQADKIYRALNRRHPFSTFRYAVEDLGILQEWYDFKNKALEELAKERLCDYDIEFKGGKIVCTDTKNITVFECEGLMMRRKKQNEYAQFDLQGTSRRQGAGHLLPSRRQSALGWKNASRLLLG